MNSGKLIPKKIEFTTLRRSTEVKLRIIVDVRGDWSYSTALFIESPPSAQLLSISEGKQETSNRNNFVNKCHRPVGFENLTSCPLGPVHNTYFCWWNLQIFVVMDWIEPKKGNPLRLNSHEFILKYLITPNGETSHDVFKWHMNNTNDSPYQASQTETNQATISYFVNPEVRIESQPDQKICHESVCNPFNQFYNFNQSFYLKNSGNISIEEATIILEIPTYTNSDPKRHVVQYNRTSIIGSNVTTLQCDHPFPKLQKEKSLIYDRTIVDQCHNRPLAPEQCHNYVSTITLP